MTRRRWVIVAVTGCVVVMAPLIVVPLIVAVLVAGGASADGPAACANNTGNMTEIAQIAGGSGDSIDDLDAEQKANAGVIILVGQQRGIDINGIISALITGYQESKYRVYANDGLGGDLAPDQLGIEQSLGLPHDAVGTDHGSLGVFQQQWPWWGTMTELMSPQTSAEKFYAALVDKVPNYQRLDPGDVAQTVQASAYPDAYHQWEPLARQLLSHADQLGGQLTTSDPSSGVAGAAVSDLCGPGAAMDCLPTGLAAERGLTPDALRVLRCVDDRFGRHHYLGVGERAANPTSDHPTGRAVDVLVDRWRSRLGNIQGWRIAHWVADHAAELGVTYVIFDAEIWSTERAAQGWRPYRHPSGQADPTSAHRDHVHVSVAGNSAGQPALGGRWQPPLKPGTYTVTATFGACSDLWSACHTGVDLAAPIGTVIFAAHAGQVTSVGYDGGGYGNYTVISTGNIDVYYAHQTSIHVQAGQVVPAGQPIGTVGQTGNTTGPHLHYEVRLDDQSVDPEPFMTARGINLRELQ